MTTPEEQLERLLDEYEDRREQGRPVSAEQLCRDCPDLLPQLAERIQKLQKLDEFFLSHDAFSGTVGGSATDTQPYWPIADGDQLPAGRFRPERFHARGGLGEVFLARDTELNRKVALKRISREQAAVEEHRRRFRFEAMLTGRLEHPGIVPVYGLGDDSEGRPVYAMRFVDGQTLRDAISEFHERSHERERYTSLEFQQLLRRFLALCQTVDYVHSRHIVHRDIKPDNVLLGKYGETLLVDWGLAKQLDSDRATEAAVAVAVAESEEDELEASSWETRQGQVQGSPAYMSPEQAQGFNERINRVSDVYGLGATLYHLLTGRPPFDGTTRDVLVHVARGNLQPPRSLQHRLPKPLDAVCRKAMAVDPEQRYVSAGELAHEIERWLADEPVAAWPDPWYVRATRWVRHHRAAVTAAVFAVTAILVALAAFNVRLSQKNTELADAKFRVDEALRQSELDRERAERSLKTGLDAVQQMLVRLGSQELSETPEMQRVRERVMVDAVAFLETFESFAGRPGLARERALALRYLADVQQSLGQPDEALQNLRLALELQQHLVERFPRESRYAVDLAATWHDWGRVHVIRNFDEAKEAFASSLELLEPLRAERPASAFVLADVHNSLGTLLASVDPAEAREQYLTAVDLWEQLTDEATPEAAESLSLYKAMAFQNLGNLSMEDPDQARDYFQAARDIVEKGTDDVLLRRRYATILLEVHNGLGVLASAESQWEEANTHHGRSLEIAAEMARLYPNVQSYRDSEARSHHNLGTSYIGSGQPQLALEEFLAAVRIREPLVERTPDDVYLRAGLAESYSSLALMHGAVGNTQEAADAFEHASEELEELVRRHPSVVRYRMSLAATEINRGTLLYHLGELDESLRVHGQAVRRLEKLRDEVDQNAEVSLQLFNAHGSRANTLIAEQRYAEALPDCDQVVALAPEHQRDAWRVWRLVTMVHVDQERSLREVAELRHSTALSPDERFALSGACGLILAALADGVRYDESERARLIEQGGDLAFELLEGLRTADYFAEPLRIEQLRSDPDFESLRGDRRFEDLLAILVGDGA